MIVDGKLETAERAVMARKGSVLIPMTTVQALLDRLGVEFETNLEGDAPQAAAPPVATPVATPVAMPAVTPVMPPAPLPGPIPVAPDVAVDGATSAPATAASPLPAPAPATAPAVPAVVLSAIETAGEAPAPALPGAPETVAPQPQAALAGKADVVGLSWGELADLAHRTPPQGIVIVHDPYLEGVARRLREKLSALPGVRAALIPSMGGGQDREAICTRAQASLPELLVDLLAYPTESAEDAPGAAPMRVWVVHQALWPRDRQAAAGEQGAALHYKRHQFQNLALGSLMRNELGRQFPDRLVLYELSPSYLLRRIDAPSAALLVPLPPGDAPPPLDADHEERLARAAYATLAGYIRGMASVEF
jgi:hypothetical protein